MPKRIPIGIENFDELVNPTQNYLFIDRTILLKKIVGDAKVLAFHTFRRSGKSLMASMLQCFFANEVNGHPTSPLFNELAISKTDPDFVNQHQGKYPVIMLSFKEVQEQNFDSAYRKMKEIIKNMFLSHHYLLESNKIYSEDKEDLRKLFADENVSKEKLENMLLTLTRLLYQHHNQRVWVIIDEYDAPLTAAYRKGYLEEMLTFMKNFLSAGLKSNSYLEKGVLVGILRISQASILSVLNNVKIYSLLNPGNYQPYFGFTEEEVRQLFNETGLLQELDNVRRWYNGYAVGGQRLYNPWSIVNCIDNQGALRPYWVNTADDSLLKECFLYAPDAAKKQFEKLITSEEVIEAKIDEGIRFEGLRTNPQALWNLLYATGYLTVQKLRPIDGGIDYIGELCIPNNEVKGVFNNIFESCLTEAFQGNHLILLNTLRQNDISQFTKMVGDYLLEFASIHHLKYEGSYHSLVLGLIYGLGDTHYVFSGRLETGLGFSDLLLIPREKIGNKQAILIEFKHTKPNETDRQAADKAFEQIDKLQYGVEVKKYPYITELLKVGMAFIGKSLVYKSELEKLKPMEQQKSTSTIGKQPHQETDDDSNKKTKLDLT